MIMRMKLLSGCFKKLSIGIRIKDGKVVIIEEEVFERWKQYFYKVLNLVCEEIDFFEGCQFDVRKEFIEMDIGFFII